MNNLLNLKNKKIICFFCGPGFMLNYHTANFIAACKNNNHKVLLACIDKGNEKNIDFCFDSKRREFRFSDLFKLSDFINFLKVNKVDSLVFFSPKASFFAILIRLFVRNIDLFHWHRGIYYENWKGIKYNLAKILDWVIIRVSKKNFYCSKSQFDWLKSKKVIGSDKTYDRKYQGFVGVKKNTKNNYMPEFDFGFIGRICKDKGFIDFYKLFLESNNKNLNYKFLIKGSIDDSDLEIADAIKSMRGHKNVHFLEWDNNVEFFYRNIKIHFFPTLREGFGNVAIEAASYGVPTIAVDGIGLRDSVSPDTGILVQNRNSLVESALKMIDEEFISSNPAVCKTAMEWVYNNHFTENLIKELLIKHEF
tara:strand:+ start:5999 stop:7090 length:1092 start_codon:yes stop_codon:yes gene_type:complete